MAADAASRAICSLLALRPSVNHLMTTLDSQPNPRLNLLRAYSRAACIRIVYLRFVTQLRPSLSTLRISL